MSTIKITSTSLTEIEQSYLQNAIYKSLPGVTYVSDLTSEVKALVINPTQDKTWINSKKFLYVATFRPEVKVIAYESILEHYSRHYKGEIKDSELEYPLDFLPSVKIFENLNISICRIDRELSDKLKKNIVENGGSVTESLSGETDVMISVATEGKRYDTALEWGIPVVSPDWCFDCVKRNLLLGTRWYWLNEDGGKGKRNDACDWEKVKVWNEQDKLMKTDRSIKKKVEKERAQAKFNVEKRVMLDDNEERELKIRRIDNEDKIWNSVLGKNDVKENKTKPVLKFIGRESMLNNKKDRKNGKILEDLIFRISGFNEEETQKLKKVLQKFGGLVEEINKKSKVDFIVVSFKSNEPVKGDNVITELAIERFLFNENVDEGKYLWCRPLILDMDIPVSEFKNAIMGKYVDCNEGKLKVCITGFQGTDLSHVEKLLTIKLDPWVEFKEIFNKDCDLLIYNNTITEDGNGNKKMEMALKWGIMNMSVDRFFNKVVSGGRKPQKS